MFYIVFHFFFVGCSKLYFQFGEKKFVYNIFLLIIILLQFVDARDIGSTLTGFVIDNSSGFKMDDSAIDMVAIRMSSAASYVTVILVEDKLILAQIVVLVH